MSSHLAGKYNAERFLDSADGFLVVPSDVNQLPCQTGSQIDMQRLFELLLSARLQEIAYGVGCPFEAIPDVLARILYESLGDVVRRIQSGTGFCPGRGLAAEEVIVEGLLSACQQLSGEVLVSDGYLTLRESS